MRIFVYLYLILTLFLVLITNNISNSFFFITYTILGISILRKGSKINKFILRIFLTTFIVYTVFGLFVYMYRELNNLEFVHAFDQLGFFDQAIDNKNETLVNLLISSINQVFINWNGGSNFIFGLVAIISNELFDTVHFLSFLITIAFVASIIIVFVFLILEKYHTQKNAFSYALFFGFLSNIFYYSGFMLRDLFIVMIYTISIYIILNKQLSTKYVLYLVFLTIIAYSFRNENGLFAISFILFFIYNNIDRQFWRSALIISLLILVFISYNFIESTLGVAIEATEQLVDYRQNRIDQTSSDSLIRILNNLPIGIKQVAEVLLFMIAPFPFYTAFKNFPEDLIFLNLSYSGIFWYFIISFLLLALFQKKAITLERKIKFLIFLVLVFLGLNTLEIQGRRMMPIYPAIFLIFTLIYPQLEKRKTKSLLISFSYMALIFIYLIFKI